MSEEKRESPFHMKLKLDRSKLSPLGRELENYWRTCLPKLYADLVRTNDLMEALLVRSEYLDAVLVDLVQQGFNEFEAREVMKHEFYFPEPEFEEGEEPYTLS